MGRRRIPCREVGCALLQRQAGFCEKHFEAAGLVVKRCTHGDCTRPYVAKGLCNVHFKRARLGQDLDRPFRGTVGFVKNGYKYVGGTTEHRAVMARALGRPLSRHENVHHKNGNRLDNRIENLELWSTAQPQGQRVEDKLSWAREILARYADDALNAEADALFDRVMLIPAVAA